MNDSTKQSQTQSPEAVRQPELPQTMTEVIDRFRGEFAFLSNFYAASVWVDGERYPTLEHAYHAAKTSDPISKKLIREAATPSLAKRLGQGVQLPADWSTRRLTVMRSLLQEKFKNPLLRSMLLATENILLVEGNTWGDVTWGVYKGKGENWLGRLLMEVRAECREEEGQ